MRKKENILFDLDGTLTDPREGITKAVRHALSAYGIHVSSLEDLLCFIGPPLKGSFKEYYGFDEDQATKALSIYREYFSVTGIFENEVYPGIPELLASLKEQGKHIYLATSKPAVYAERILEHFGLISYFDFVGGSLLSGERVEKEDVVDYVLETNHLHRADTVMVGDRKFDILGAKAAGLSSVGVLYGYGDREELLGADALAETVEDLNNILL